MTTECCKFCGAGVWYSKDGDGAFECRTDLDYSWRSSECAVATCARYESLFPIPPWSTEPITAEVCEQLGMVYDQQFEAWFVAGRAEFGLRAYDDGMIWISEDWNKHVELAGLTAGQLACLIAARKGASQ